MDCPTRYAISAQMPTPTNPENAGWTESRPIRRHTNTSAATPTAAPIAGSRPDRPDTATKVTTGSEE